MGTWIPPEQRDTRWYLWNARFQCRVPFLQSQALASLKHFGLPTSGDTRLDRSMRDELVERALCIDEMVELFKQGVTVGVIQPKDTVKIYEHISAHLTKWKDLMMYRMNRGDAPIEDLVLLDQLAQAVYPHAQSQFGTDVVDSFLARNISSVMRFNRGEVFKPKHLAEVEMTEEERERARLQSQPQRESMADIFSSFRPRGGFKRS